MAGLPFAALILCLHITAGESQFTIIVAHSQINVTAGGDAFLSVRPSSNVSSGNWTFDGKTVVQWIGRTVSVHSSYTSRAELFTSNGSLLLKSVNESDSGEYRVNMVPTNGSQTSATVTLRVIEPVSNVTVTSNVTVLIEYNDTVTLTCSATGTDVSYLWFEENITITPGGRFELSADNITLTVAGVLRTDGSFTCRASNLINEITSEPFYLNVSYGPDRPLLIAQPDSSLHVAGSTVTLRCFTQSHPVADLYWQLNGVYLQTGQLLILNDISVNGTGNYTCEAWNWLTGRYNASTIQINVLAPVTGVAVLTNDSTPVENLDTIALSCVASGTVQTRTWFKDNQPIQENGRIFTSPDKAKLTVIRVNRNDAGTYKCVANNSFSSDAGVVEVQVYCKYTAKTDGSSTLTAGAIVGIVLGLVGVGLIGGVSGWLIARKAGGVRDPPQSQNDTSINSGRRRTLDTNTVNASENYANFSRNQQGAMSEAEDGSSTYMGLVLEDRSVYGDLTR